VVNSFCHNINRIETNFSVIEEAELYQLTGVIIPISESAAPTDPNECPPQRNILSIRISIHPEERFSRMLRTTAFLIQDLFSIMVSARNESEKYNKTEILSRMLNDTRVTRNPDP
jgi:hypothetical protein